MFVKVWQKSHLYNRKKGRFFTCLLNIARNAAINFTRSKEYNTQKKNHSLEFFVHILEKPVADDATEDYSALKRLISKLKKKCVQLIELLYYKNYTQKDAAEELTIPLETVKSRNRNCLKALRLEIESDDE